MDWDTVMDFLNGQTEIILKGTLRIIEWTDLESLPTVQMITRTNMKVISKMTCSMDTDNFGGKMEKNILEISKKINRMGLEPKLQPMELSCIMDFGNMDKLLKSVFLDRWVDKTSFGSPSPS